ncbi:LysR family transcriptional regulator [Pseudoroseomonas globiformis]|uniref:LysR family transcriptional regulator n=1 Tax=Teichococcus globiformis TaxID=2307229 RepID=A0ABV7G025_9PROT
MDKLEVMRLLTRIVERRSFSAAAGDLAVPRSTATEAIKQLEARLGVRLLDRTTRHVSPTLDGEAYYRRCVAILAEIEDAEGGFADRQPRGVLRIDVHGNMFRQLVLPRLPEFLTCYPEIGLRIGEGDRLVDLVREGVDCVVRAGLPAGNGMIARRLGELPEATAASPGYLARHGTPRSPDELAGHQMIGFLSSASGEVLPLEFTRDGQVQEVRLPGRLTVTGSDTSAALARLGYGLVQAPRYRFEADFRSGTLLEVLPDFPPSPTPVSALYPQSRQLSPRVRVFVDWLVQVFRSVPQQMARGTATAATGGADQKAKSY